MKRIVLLSALFYAVIGVLAAAPALATNTGQVCPAGDSGKINVSGNHKTLILSAPEGKLIDGYCVKAGSVQQGNGPEFHAVNPPAAVVTIAHSSGKDISHYSLTYTEVPPSTTTTTVPPTTTTVPPVTTVPPTTSVPPAPSTTVLAPTTVPVSTAPTGPGASAVATGELPKTGAGDALAVIFIVGMIVLFIGGALEIKARPFWTDVRTGKRHR